MAITSAGEVKLDLTANTRPFERTANAVTSNFQGMFGKLGAMAGKLLAVGALVKFGKEALDVASALNEVQNVVDVTFPHMNAQLEAWAQNAADAFGMSELLAKKYSSRLGSMAEATGFSEAAAYEMGTAITQLAGDVASFYDLDHEEAYNKLTAIFTGQTRALMDLGVVMNATNLNEYALAQGMSQTYEQMNATEKATLRYQYVMSALSNTQGDFARTSGSWANQVRLLTLRFEEFKAAVGQSLIAVLLPVVKVLNAIIAAATLAARAFNRVIEAITGKSMGELTGGAVSAGVAVGNLGGAAGGAADSTDDLAAAQGNAAKAAKAQEKAQKDLNRTLAGFDRINKLTSNADNLGAGSGGGGGGIGGGGGGIDALGGIADAAEDAQSALDKLVLPEKLIAAFDRLRESVGRFADIVSGGLKWAYDNVLVPLANWTINEVVPDAINFIADIVDDLSGYLEACAEPLQTIATIARDDIMWIYENVFKPFGEWFAKSALPKLLETMASALSVIASIIEKLHPILKAVWENILAPIAKVIGDVILAALDGINLALQGLAQWIQRLDLSGLERFIEDIGDGLQQLGSWLGRTLAPLWDAEMQRIGSYINNFLKPLGETLGTVASKVGDVLVPVLQILYNTILKPLGDFLGNVFNKVLEAFTGGSMDAAQAWDLLGKAMKTIYETYIKPVFDQFNELYENSFLPKLKKFVQFTEENGGAPLLASQGITGEYRLKILAEDWTEEGIDKAKESLKGLPDKKDTKLGAQNDTEDGITKAKVPLGKFAALSWLAKLAGKDETKAGVDEAKSTIDTRFPKSATANLKGTRDKSLWWSNTSGALRVSADLIKTKFNGKTVPLRASNQTWKLANGKAGGLQNANNHLKTKYVGKSVPLGAWDNTEKPVNTAIKSINSKKAWLEIDPWLTKSNIELYSKSNSKIGFKMYAMGGFVQKNTPELAVIGDNRHEGEYVLPESVLNRALVEAGMRGGGGGNATALLPILQSILSAIQSSGEVYLDGKAISRNVVNHINQQVQSTGRSPLLV